MLLKIIGKISHRPPKVWIQKSIDNDTATICAIADASIETLEFYITTTLSVTILSSIFTETTYTPFARLPRAISSTPEY